MNALQTVVAVLAATALLPGLLRADEWDSAAAGDVGFGTSNVLAHGAEQIHDLATVGGVADQDWYRLTVRPMSSYEMVIDGQTGDVGLQSPDLQRVAQTGTVLQSAREDDLGFVLRLAWRQEAADTQLVRVRDAACNGAGCVGTDRYRIRFYETTYTIPRFNNTASQTTVLLLQNLTDRACRIVYHFLTPTGVIEVPGGDLSPYVLNALNTAQFVPGRSGSVRLSHDCGYGAFSGKAVSVEPATGFTFDTPLRHRAN